MRGRVCSNFEMLMKNKVVKRMTYFQKGFLVIAGFSTANFTVQDTNESKKWRYNKSDREMGLNAFKYTQNHALNIASSTELPLMSFFSNSRNDCDCVFEFIVFEFAINCDMWLSDSLKPSSVDLCRSDFSGPTIIIRVNCLNSPPTQEEKYIDKVVKSKHEYFRISNKTTIDLPVIVFRTKRLSSVLNMNASLFPPDSLAAEILASDL